MDDSAGEAICFFVPCLVGVGLYLLFDTIRSHNRRRLATLEDPDAPTPEATATGVYQLNYRSPRRKIPPSFPRPSGKAVVRAIAILAACAGLVASMEFYQFHMRHTVLTFVDAATGKPVPVVVSYETFYDAQTGDYAHARYGATPVTANVVEYEWNCPVSLTVTQAGYQLKEITLVWDQTPQVIRLEPNGTPAATQAVR